MNGFDTCGPRADTDGGMAGAVMAELVIYRDGAPSNSFLLHQEARPVSD